MRRHRLTVLVLLAGLGLSSVPAQGQTLVWSLFERYLEALRQQAGIPGLSAALVQDGEVVWSRGLGYQDVARSIAARPDTPYVIADLTQTLSSVLVLKCVAKSQLTLLSPMEQWSLALGNDLTVRDALAHALPRGQATRTNRGFRYDAARFVALTPVIADCQDGPYPLVLAREILDPMAMTDSVPGLDLSLATAPARRLFDARTLARYEAVLSRVATPYTRDTRDRLTKLDRPLEGINAASGLVSTVLDLAKFDTALDDGVLLDAGLRTLSWTNVTRDDVVSLTGEFLPLPTGLGWFVQRYTGEQVVWHFGQAPGASSLILKVPGRHATLILLANSDGLSVPFSLSKGDVTTSVFARLFLRLFIDPPSTSSISLESIQ